ncbi:MAG: hypothetical protein QXX20_00630 [Candidatus Thermoplasmatota archaeon]
MEYTYQELDQLLDALLEKNHLPSLISYKDTQVHYQRKHQMRIIFIALYRLFKAQYFYMNLLQDQLKKLKTTGPVYHELKKTRCLKNLRTYLYLSKVGLTDLAQHLNGAFDYVLCMHFAFATMLYDAAFDVPLCSKYLKDFDQFIMQRKKIESSDPYLLVFQESVDTIEQRIGSEHFDVFMSYVQIEHISQLMSRYQRSDVSISKEDLMKITFAKGGISGLALMHLFVPTMTQEQRGAIYELGAVMQLIDDISDIKEDVKIGIRTLPNQRLLSFQELQELYYGTVNHLIDACNMDPYTPNGTLDMLCWFSEIILNKRYQKLMHHVE